MKLLLFLASALCSLIALMFSAISYVPSAQAQGMTIVVIAASLSILLALIAALRKPRAFWLSAACGLLLAFNLFHITAAARSLWP